MCEVFPKWTGESLTQNEAVKTKRPCDQWEHPSLASDAAKMAKRTKEKETFKSYVQLDVPNEEPLIQFEDEPNTPTPDLLGCPELTTSPDRNVSLLDSPETTSDTSDSSEQKLCGFLNKYKIGARGIGKNFKRRWFVYGENSCKLLYFRTPQDIVAYGEIDISNASFYYDPVEKDRANVFEIRNQGKTVLLEASDRQTMMYWLQELQTKRRAYSQRRTRLAKEEPISPALPQTQQQGGGLLRSDPKIPISREHDVFPLVETIDTPHGRVGEAAATAHSHRLSIADLSISNWKTEVRNALATFRSRRQSEYETVETVEPPVGELVCPESGLSSPTTNVTSHPSYSMSDPNLHARKYSGGSREFSWSSIKRKLGSRPKSVAATAEPTSPSDQQRPTCPRCKQLQGSLLSLRDDLNCVEEELEAHREIVKLSEKEIDTLKKQQDTQREYQAMINMGNTDAVLEKLQENDRRIVGLEHLVTATQEEKEIFRAQLRASNSEVNSLKEEIAAYKESLTFKDETIIALTTRVEEVQEKKGSELRDLQDSSTNTSLRAMVDMREMNKLKDAVSGYESQNKFLNKEILELTNLRADDEAREKQLYMKCTELEGRYYQIQSKYLLCLEQLRKPQRGGLESKSEDMVTQLLEDAMTTEVKHKMADQQMTSRFSNNEYDKYGFLLVPLGGEDDLVAKATSLQRKSEELKGKNVDREVSLSVKWENFMLSMGNRDLQRSPELKMLIRLGVPPHHRERIWNACVDFRVGQQKERYGVQYYHTLLESLKKTTRHNPAAKQIELDLLRTLPNNRHYENLSSEGVPKLRRILLAYTQHNPMVGYCQGLNRLVAIALLFLTEEDAFWCLVAIIEHIMPPDYYSATLLAAQTDQRVLKEIIAEKLPRLHSHLEQHEVDLSLFTFNWFLTIFVDNIPVETYLRIWDTFLYEGNKVLFRYAIATFKLREEQILTLKDTMSIHRYLRAVGESITDIDKVSNISFNDINPFPMRHIQTKRNVYLGQVKAELAELEQIRCRYRSNSENQERQDFTSDDEMSSNNSRNSESS